MWGLQLEAGVLAHGRRTRDQLAHVASHDRGAMVGHQTAGMLAERRRASERPPRLDHQQVGVAELVALVPDGMSSPTAARGETRHDRHAGDDERQHRAA